MTAARSVSAAAAAAVALLSLAVCSARPLQEGAKALPVVIWHGPGDSCCAVWSAGGVKKLIQDKLGVFVHSINTGSSDEFHDIQSSFYGLADDQVDAVCRELAGKEELRGGFNMVGLSQGGLLLRAVVERCGHKLPPVHTLVTLGAPHGGLAAPLACTTELSLTPPAAKMCREVAADGSKQGALQGQFMLDPKNPGSAGSFLADVNGKGNPQYGQNLAALKRLVLFRFDEDATVVPRDSAWFAAAQDDQGAAVPLFDQPLYKEDWLGLKRLNDAGALLLRSAPGAHMAITADWVADKVVQPFLAAA